MSTKNIESRIEELEMRMERLEKSLDGNLSSRPPTLKKISAKEFLMKKNAKADTQKVHALGYFLERMEGMTSFNVPDLVGAFRAAKERLPKNMNDSVNKNIARGFFMAADAPKDAKKAWYLTATGERVVENEMNK